ncbi:prevent-host-death protein [Dactylosporangium vinaceum]|nr:prevent-host-death protein [Dactylosporangium vinaceum]
MSIAAHFDSYTSARAHFKELLDAARRGRVATVQRETGRAAVVDADRLRVSLMATLPAPQAVAEDGGWSIMLPGVPIAADGTAFDEAVDELIMALREYADDWQERLLDAPNHRNNWALVQVVALSSDEQLRDWLTGSAR